MHHSLNTTNTNLMCLNAFFLCGIQSPTSCQNWHVVTESLRTPHTPYLSEGYTIQFLFVVLVLIQLYGHLEENSSLWCKGINL